MSVQNLTSYLEELPMSLKEFAASENFYRLEEFEYCPLTFIYNTVTCVVSIYDGNTTDSLIIEVHNINGLRYLERAVHKLVRFIFEKHKDTSIDFTKLTNLQLLEWIKANKDSPLLDEAIAEKVRKDESESTVTYSVEEFEDKLSEKLGRLLEEIYTTSDEH
jgi:hypothetical protein